MVPAVPVILQADPAEDVPPPQLPSPPDDTVAKQAIDQLWDQIRQKYGVYIRLIERLPESSLQTRPVERMRSPAELVTHISGTVVRDIAQGVAGGEIVAGEEAETGVATALTSRAEAVAFAAECWELADAAVAATGDAELAAMVPTPWDMTAPGWVFFHVMSDELVHHRGQLYVFARLLGIEPPFIWSHEENPPRFRPAA